MTVLLFDFLFYSSLSAGPLVSEGSAAVVAARVVSWLLLSAAELLSRAGLLSRAELLSAALELSPAEPLSRVELLFFAPELGTTLPRESVEASLPDSLSRDSPLSRVLFVPFSELLRLRLVSSSVVLRFFEEEVSFSSLSRRIFSLYFLSSERPR